jgi:NYN domain
LSDDWRERLSRLQNTNNWRAFTRISTRQSRRRRADTEKIIQTIRRFDARSGASLSRDRALCWCSGRALIRLNGNASGHRMKDVHRRGKVALFIDGAKLHAAAKALGFDVDYKRLLEEFSAGGSLLRAFYYITLMEDLEYCPLRPLVDWLDYNGYTVVTTPIREHADDIGAGPGRTWPSIWRWTPWR